MAEVFGIGSGIVDVIGLTVQIAQLVAKFGLDWKEAPTEAQAFMQELLSLKVTLQATLNIIKDQDFKDTFENCPSALLAQLGPTSPDVTETKQILENCQKELESIVIDLKKQNGSRRLALERLKGAFNAKDTRKSVQNLHRRSEILNRLISVDTLTLGIATYKKIKETRTEHQEWHRTEMDQNILDWLTAVDYGGEQSNHISRRQEGTYSWLLNKNEFQTWSSSESSQTQGGQTIFCPGIPGAGKTILTSIVVK